jgi:hypothetical protein
MAEVVAAKNADVDSWIAMSSYSLPGNVTRTADHQEVR